MPTIHAVVSKLQQFARTCADFDVPSENITVLATEATRTALNSVEFRAAIKDATGWEVRMLPKEEEGRVGALGVATSLGTVKGLVMDLGGGSTQLTWLTTDASGKIAMPASGAVSMPFGAAALSRGLEEAQAAGGDAKARFANQVRTALKTAYESLAVPAELQDLARTEGGYALYLSGGGFRGWGFLLMSQHPIQPYPIPVINGLTMPRSAFLDTAAVQAAVSEDQANDDAIFRISQRRASQVPAVAFLVQALSEALPQIKEVRFCQGGVREGYLFSTLPDEVRLQQPIAVATAPYASDLSPRFLTLLAASLPSSTTSSSSASSWQAAFTKSLLEALANILPLYSTHPKDIRAASALRSTTTGVLASAHGLAHSERALLALALCERWGGAGDLPPTDLPLFRGLQELVGPWGAWWARYLGSVGALVGAVLPSGRSSSGQQKERLALGARWGMTGKGNEILMLEVRMGDREGWRGMVGDEVLAVEKCGKKKNWVGGKEGCGFRVEVVVV